MSEEWRAVVGFEGLYEVSNLGQIRSPICILRQQIQSNGGHLRVVICKKGKYYGRYVHRLVCEAFNGPPPFPKAQALHKDDIETNNIPSNLYWGTHQQNMDDMEANGNRIKGENHPGAILNWDKVREIRRLYAEGMKPAHIAKKFGVAGTRVHSIIRNKTWKERSDDCHLSSEC